MRRVIVGAGFPGSHSGSIGGAGSEAYETYRLFQRHGIEVHCIATWEDPPPERRREVEAAGITVHVGQPSTVAGILRDLGSPPVLSFCNRKFVGQWHRIKDVSPFIWVNCMTYLMQEERLAWKKGGMPSAFVFQSEYQRTTCENRLQRFGYRDDLGHSIRGAFCWDDWPFQPLAREPGGPFVIGRAARPDTAKWHGSTLEMLDDVPNRQAILLGVDEAVARTLGRRKWARQIKPSAMPQREFYSQLHAMIAANGSARENWPRVGLEAMAQGVPLVVDGHFGWTEMVRHGDTGFHAQSPREFTGYLQDLERDDGLRLRVAGAARLSLEQELANPQRIWDGWRRVFRSIGAGHLAEEQGT